VPPGGRADWNACTANVPSQAKTNNVVNFLAGFPVGCNPQVAWTFGDSSSAAVRNAAKVFVNPGTYAWNMTQQSPGYPASCVRTGTIAVAPGTATCQGDCSANVPTNGLLREE